MKEEKWEKISPSGVFFHPSSFILHPSPVMMFAEGSLGGRRMHPIGAF